MNVACSDGPPPPVEAFAPPDQVALSSAQDAFQLLLSRASQVQAFKGRWMVISDRAQRISDALLFLLLHHHYSSAAFAAAHRRRHHHSLPLLNRHSAPPPPELLPSSILSSAHDALLLAQQSIDLSYGGGKLLMQSKLDAIATKLDLHLRELEAIRCAIKQQERAAAIAMSSSACNRATKTIAGDVVSENHQNRHGCLDEVVMGQVWEMFSKLRMHASSDSKKAALLALIRYLSDVEGGDGAESASKKQISVAMAMRQQSRECRAAELGRLVHLLDSSSQTIRERAAHVVSLFCASPALPTPSEDDSASHLIFIKRCLVGELAAHSALIRVAESGSSAAKDKAAFALLHLSSVAENAHSIAAHSGAIPALAALCRTGHPPDAAASAAGTLRNLAAHEHLRRSLADDDTIASLITALAPERGADERLNAGEALCNLCARGKDDRIRSSAARLGGVPALLLLLQVADDHRSKEVAVRALTNLASSAANAKAVVAAGFVSHLTELLRSGSPSLQRLAATSICALSPYIDLKKQLGRAGCVTALTEILEGGDEAGDGGTLAAQALSTLLLADSNRKVLYKTEEEAELVAEGRRGVARLAQLLEPRHRTTAAKRFPMSALWALTGGKSLYRKRITAQPAMQPPRESGGSGAGGKLRGFFQRQMRSQLRHP